MPSKSLSAHSANISVPTLYITKSRVMNKTNIVLDLMELMEDVETDIKQIVM